MWLRESYTDVEFKLKLEGENLANFTQDFQFWKFIGVGSKEASLEAYQALEKLLETLASKVLYVPFFTEKRIREQADTAKVNYQ